MIPIGRSSISDSASEDDRAVGLLNRSSKDQKKAFSVMGGSNGAVNSSLGRSGALAATNSRNEDGSSVHLELDRSSPSSSRTKSSIFSHFAGSISSSLSSTLSSSLHLKYGLPTPLGLTFTTLDGLLDALRHGNSIGRGMDDRKMLLESIITFLSRLPRASPATQFLQDRLITLLWNDLPHPPCTFIGVPRALSLPNPHSASASEVYKLPEEKQSLCPFARSSSSTPYASYPYHTPDGSYNNPFLPSLGIAGCPYSRTVQSTNATAPTTLPDPGIIFDALFARREIAGTEARKHPGGLSSLFFAFANLVIHSLFQTEMPSPASPPHTQGGTTSSESTGAGYSDPSSPYSSLTPSETRNLASSYLDLSPLYGSSASELAKVRRMDGTGKLWEDTWADTRIGYMPPSTVAMVILFSRNHNYIASTLLTINEAGLYVDPSTFDSSDERPASKDASTHSEKNDLEQKKVEQDDHIFERARLINCHHFMQVILSDYLGAILGLTREGNDFTLEPLGEIANGSGLVPGGGKVPRGVGNAVSVEFNLLYRWHATLSPSEVRYTEGLFAKLWPGVDPHKLSGDEFMSKLTLVKNLGSSADPRTRPLPLPPSPLTARLPNGAFRTEVIAGILKNATMESAHPFGARCTPAVMRVVEMMGIEQARRWGCGSINELRKALGLKEYETFLEWNSDPEIANTAEALYGHVNNLELYPGLVAESAKPSVPGAGLCPGYTISRAILSDAVALVRGDRLLSIERTPHNMTAWGYQDTLRDTENGAFGCALSKIIFRTLPGQFTYNSALAMFPFLVPQSMQAGLRKARPELVEKYDWTLPSTMGPTSGINGIVNGKNHSGVTNGSTKLQNGTTSSASASSFSAIIHLTPADLPKDTDLLQPYGPPLPSISVTGALLGSNYIPAVFESTGKKRKLRPILDSLYPPDSKQHKTREYKAFIYERISEDVEAMARSYSVVQEKGKISQMYQVEMEKVLGDVPLQFVNSKMIPLPPSLTSKSFQILFDYIFRSPFALDQSPVFHLKEKATEVKNILFQAIKVELRKHTSITHSLKSIIRGSDSFVDSFISQFFASKSYLSEEQAASEIFMLLVSLIPLWSLAMENVVSFYMDDIRETETEKIIALCLDHYGNQQEIEQLLGDYCQKALRADPAVPIITRTIIKDAGKITVHSQNRVLNLSSGHTVAINLNAAESGDERNPDLPERSEFDYWNNLLGLGDHHDLLAPLILESMPQVLRAVFSLPKVHLATQNRMGRFKAAINRLGANAKANLGEWLYLGDEGKLSRWPQSLVVRYESKETTSETYVSKMDG